MTFSKTHLKHFVCVHMNPIPGWMDPNKLLMTVAMNATANTGKIWSPTSESSWRPSLKGSRSSVILNEYPSPIKRTRRLQTANTLMVTGQKDTEDPGIQGKESRGPQTWARPDYTRQSGLAGVREGGGSCFSRNVLRWPHSAYSGVSSEQPAWAPAPSPGSWHTTGRQRLSGSDTASRLGSDIGAKHQRIMVFKKVHRRYPHQGKFWNSQHFWLFLKPSFPNNRVKVYQIQPWHQIITHKIILCICMSVLSLCFLSFLIYVWRTRHVLHLHWYYVLSVSKPFRLSSASLIWFWLHWRLAHLDWMLPLPS